VSRPVASQRRIRHPWGLGIGIVLVLPQLVICVVVLRDSFFVALIGFLLTIGSVRLGSLGYRALRERVPPVGRGRLVLAGLAAVILGSVLWSAVRTALQGTDLVGYTGAVYPAAAVWLNLVSVLTLVLWPAGAAMLVWALAGMVADRRRAA
jgi:hypothetical protein